MKINILLVEYCSETIEAVRQMFHHDIFDIIVARTEETAKELMSKIDFDLLITETLLPKSHGFILAQYVSKTYPNTKIIIISEKLKKADYNQEAMSYGAIEFFEKPLNRKEFGRRVFQILDLNEDQLEEASEEGNMTTNIHVLPLLEELRAEKKKNGIDPDEKDVFDKIRENLDTDSSFKIDLD